MTMKFDDLMLLAALGVAGYVFWKAREKQKAANAVQAANDAAMIDPFWVFAGIAG